MIRKGKKTYQQVYDPGDVDDFIAGLYQEIARQQIDESVQNLLDTKEDLENGHYGRAAFSLTLALTGRYGGRVLKPLRGKIFRNFESDLCCFVAGTPVLTKDGLKPIEQIVVGDMVLAKDVVTGEQTLKPITGLIQRHDRQIWEVTIQDLDGEMEQFRTTNDHPWWVGGDHWVTTDDLEAGMVVENKKGQIYRIVSVLETSGREPTFNLTVADFETYYVGESRILVHNCRNLWKITKEGTSRTLRHGRFGKFHKSKTDGSWWSKDLAGHGGSKWKVFKEEADGLHWRFDADEFGTEIPNKHKSDIGSFIPWKELNASSF